MPSLSFFFFFFFNDTATTEIYTLSLHDALPILQPLLEDPHRVGLLVEREVSPHLPTGVAHPGRIGEEEQPRVLDGTGGERSEEHTSELQSPCNIVCRLLLEKKKKNIKHTYICFI